jgi:mannose-6-phosphate isomerase-like protein (cupin superfamily)
MPEPRIINIEPDKESEHLVVLSGPPQTVSMRSGVVTLEPEGSVGLHSTENYEELIIILEGQATILVKGRTPVMAESGNAFYCPPDTEHDVFNSGTEPLRYIYIVAETRK